MISGLVKQEQGEEKTTKKKLYRNKDKKIVDVFCDVGEPSTGLDPILYIGYLDFGI